MNIPTERFPISRPAQWSGRILSGLVILFLAMDIALKLIGFPQVAVALAQLGWPVAAAMPLGVLLLLCGVLYAVPATSPLGAVLLTGYLGGAVATHARVGDPLLSHTLFGVYVGLAMWLGLWLRDARLRALLPRRR